MNVTLTEKPGFPVASTNHLTVLFQLIGIDDASAEKTSRLGHPITTDPPLRQESEDETWTEEKNKRRCALIDRKYADTLTPDQARELARLQSLMLYHRQRIAPLPLEDAERLYRKLLAEVGESSAPTEP